MFNYTFSLIKKAVKWNYNLVAVQFPKIKLIINSIVMKKKPLLLKVLFATMLLVCMGSINVNAQTLMHSYTFEDGTANDVVGTVHPSVIGTGSSFDAGAITLTGGETYLEFSAADLALNTYDALTIESHVTVGEQNGDYNVLYYFGGNNEDNAHYLSIVRGNNVSQVSANKNHQTGPEPAVGETHHYVTVLTHTTLKLYIDGELIGEKETAGDELAAIGADNAWIGKSTWPDKNWNGTIYEYNIYNGELDDATIMDKAMSALITNGSSLKELTLGSGNLYPDFKPTITEYIAILPEGSTSLDISAVAYETGVTINGSGTVQLDGAKGDLFVNVSNGPTDITEYVIHYMVDTDLTLKHSYDFETAFNVYDVVGGVDGTAESFFAISDGAWNADGTNKITLPADQIALNTYPSISLESFVEVGAHDTYTMLYFFGGEGNNNSTFFRITANNDDHGRDQSQATICNASVEYPEPAEGELHHYVTVIEYGSISLYVDGALVGSKDIIDPGQYISNIGADVAYIGASTWPDPVFLGKFFEFNIYSGAMDAATVLSRAEGYGVSTAIEKKPNVNAVVYPTISSDNFTVDFKGKPGVVSVYDLTGNLVDVVTPSSSKAIITVENAGVYIVKVQKDGAVKTFKVIKK